MIGIGVNVRHAPEGMPYPATSLADCGAEVTAETLFTALAEAWVDQERSGTSGRGFAAIRGHWLERAAGLGAPIAVQLGDEVVRGIFETIDDEGRLIVRAADGSSRADQRPAKCISAQPPRRGIDGSRRTNWSSWRSAASARSA